MKKTLFLISAALLFISGAQAQEVAQGPALKLTLEECLDYALVGNYTRQSTQLNESSQEAALAQAKMERLPGVSASVSESYSHSKASGDNWGGNYDVSANMTVFQGGQINSTITQNELQYEQAQLRTQKYDNDLVIQVLQAFLTAVGNEELLKYQEAIVESSREQAADAKVRYQAGMILESDYLLLEAQYSTDLDNITSSRISRDNSLVALKNLMAMDLLQPIELVYPEDEALTAMLQFPTQEEVIERGLMTLPEIRISEYSVEIAEAGVRISRSSLYPTISLSAGVGTGHINNFDKYGTQLSDRLSPQAGVSVSIPIFNRNRARTNIKQSEIALKQAELDSRQAELDIEQTLISEYGNVVSSGSKFQASQIRQNAYKSSFDAYTEMFRAGSITPVELLQQQNNYISALNDYIQNKYTFMLQRKVLDVYMGNPIKM